MDKDKIQRIAERIADERYNKDFYDLPENVQGKVYEEAMDEYAQNLSDSVDMNPYLLREVARLKQIHRLKADGFKPYRKLPVVVYAKRMSEPFETKTLAGALKGKAGDWLMIGVNGEQYPCADDIFKKTYIFVDPKEET